MSGKFEIGKAKDGQTFFRLKATNGQVILASEMYKAKRSALKGIESVKRNALSAARFEKLTSKNGKFYFNLKAGNSLVIGTSEMYETESSRDKGIEAVMKNAPISTTVESS